MNTQQTQQTVNMDHRFNLDGSANPKYVDLLDEDKPLSGQRYACLSFISPEKILKQRDLFNFETFLKQWDMNKSLQKYREKRRFFV